MVVLLLWEFGNLDLALGFCITMHNAGYIADNPYSSTAISARFFLFRYIYPRVPREGIKAGGVKIMEFFESFLGDDSEPPITHQSLDVA